MKKSALGILVPLVAIAMTAGLSTAANAGIGGPTSLSVGAFWPSSDDASSTGGGTQLNADLRYHVPAKNNTLNVPSRTVFDVGIEAGATDGAHSTIVPVTIGEEIGLSNQSPLAVNNGFLGAGIGVYFVDQSFITSSAELGGYVNAGYNISASTFVEGKYQFADHGDGPMLDVGFRF